MVQSTTKRYAIRFNDEELVFSNAIFISPTGNDETGDGSKENPFATPDKAVEILTDSTSVIVFLEGDYELTPIVRTQIETLKKDYYRAAYGYGYYYGYSDYSGVRIHHKSVLYPGNKFNTTFLGLGVVNINCKLNTYECFANTYKKNMSIINININIDSLVTASNVTDIVTPPVVTSLPFNSVSNNASSLSIGTINLKNCLINFVNHMENMKVITSDIVEGNINYDNCTINMGDIYNSYIGLMNGHSHNRTSGGGYGLDLNTNRGQHSLKPVLFVNVIFINLEESQIPVNRLNQDYFRFNMTNCLTMPIKYLPTSSYHTITDTILEEINIDPEGYPLLSSSWKHNGLVSIKNPEYGNPKSNIGIFGGSESRNKTTIDKNALIRFTDGYIQEIERNLDKDIEFNINAPLTQDVDTLVEIYDGEMLDVYSVKYEKELNKNEIGDFKIIDFV